MEEKRELVHSQKRLYRFCQESLLSGLLTLDMGDPLPGEEDAVSMERNFAAMLEPPRWKLFKRNAFR